MNTSSPVFFLYFHLILEAPQSFFLPLSEVFLLSFFFLLSTSIFFLSIPHSRFFLISASIYIYMYIYIYIYIFFFFQKLLTLSIFFTLSFSNSLFFYRLLLGVISASIFFPCSWLVIFYFRFVRLASIFFFLIIYYCCSNFFFSVLDLLLLLFWF